MEQYEFVDIINVAKQHRISLYLVQCVFDHVLREHKDGQNRPYLHKRDLCYLQKLLLDTFNHNSGQEVLMVKWDCNYKR